MVLVLKKPIEKKGKTSNKDIQEWIGGSYSKTKHFTEQLVATGYLTTDRAKPQGFLPTDKAKQLFWVVV
ncbi:hypothetical protein [Acinetobacter sp.]|jgi:hypothetical protein|uniref:hypothetical protein n=1 Tax=Acinetobacter sp. TaxID=472 RepID=UPI00281A1223|nr:hypothetical protein [Acinetobacter sp.]MDR0238113.1 hypothetical protein [Acinetobacter sp.]